MSQSLSRFPFFPSRRLVLPNGLRRTLSATLLLAGVLAVGTADAADPGDAQASRDARLDRAMEWLRRRVPNPEGTRVRFERLDPFNRNFNATQVALPESDMLFAVLDPSQASLIVSVSIDDGEVNRFDLHAPSNDGVTSVDLRRIARLSPDVRIFMDGEVSAFVPARGEVGPRILLQPPGGWGKIFTFFHEAGHASDILARSTASRLELQQANRRLYASNGTGKDRRIVFQAERNAWAGALRSVRALPHGPPNPPAQLRAFTKLYLASYAHAPVQLESSPTPSGPTEGGGLRLFNRSLPSLEGPSTDPYVSALRQRYADALEESSHYASLSRPPTSTGRSGFLGTAHGAQGLSQVVSSSVLGAYARSDLEGAAVYRQALEHRAAGIEGVRVEMSKYGFFHWKRWLYAFAQTGNYR